MRPYLFLITAEYMLRTIVEPGAPTKPFLPIIATVIDSFMSCLTYDSDEGIRMEKRTRVVLRIIGVEIYWFAVEMQKVTLATIQEEKEIRTQIRQKHSHARCV